MSLYRKYADDLHIGRITEIPENGTQKASVSQKGRNGKPRPKKPYPDFPLFPHAVGQWAKKIKGKLYYFGPWTDPQGSLDKYLAQKDDLFAGRTPRVVTADGCTVRNLVNRFLASKEQLVESGELAKRSFDDYHKECEKVIAVFGRHRMVEDLTPEDFEALRAELAKKLGPVAFGNAINRVRILFKYAYDQFLVDKPGRQAWSTSPCVTARRSSVLAGRCSGRIAARKGLECSRPSRFAPGSNGAVRCGLIRWQRLGTQWPTRPNRGTKRSPVWCSHEAR